MTTLPLRPYQHEAITAMGQAWRRGVRRQLVVMPTGSGKTVVFAHLTQRRAPAGRTLVIAHRQELLTQAVEKLFTVAPELRVGIVKAARDEHRDVDVIVGSIQTLARPRRLEPLIGTVSTVIVDEAHHAAAETYRSVLTGLGCFEEGPLTVGVTATAGRGDKVGLGHIWEEIVYQRGILYMIAHKYLVDVTALQIHTDMDLDRVATNRGDYTDSSLGLELDHSGAIEAAADAYATHARDRRGIAFTPTIATADDLAARLRALGIPAEALSGETAPDLRRAILRRLSTGETQVVCNCAVLTEGFDEPAVSCVLIARPTRSRPLFIQMAGRALRKHPGKDKALVLDLYAPPEAGLATVADLAGLDPDDAFKVKEGETLLDAAIRDEAESRAWGKQRTRSKLTAEQIDLFARSNLRWLPVGEGFVLPCGQSSVLLVPQGDERYSVLRTAQSADPVTVTDTPLTLEWAQGVGEEYARGHGGVISRADARWRQKPVTPRQRSTLERMKLPVPETCGEASDAMSVIFASRLITKLRQAA